MAGGVTTSTAPAGRAAFFSSTRAAFVWVRSHVSKGRYRVPRVTSDIPPAALLNLVGANYNGRVPRDQNKRFENDSSSL